MFLDLSTCLIHIFPVNFCLCKTLVGFVFSNGQCVRSCICVYFQIFAWFPVEINLGICLHLHVFEVEIIYIWNLGMWYACVFIWMHFPTVALYIYILVLVFACVHACNLHVFARICMQWKYMYLRIVGCKSALQQGGKSDKMPPVEIHTGKKLREIGILKFGKSNAAWARQRLTLICQLFSLSTSQLGLFRKENSQNPDSVHISNKILQKSPQHLPANLFSIMHYHSIYVSISFTSILLIWKLSKKPLKKMLSNGNKGNHLEWELTWDIQLKKPF